MADLYGKEYLSYLSSVVDYEELAMKYSAGELDWLQFRQAVLDLIDRRKANMPVEHDQREGK